MIQQGITQDFSYNLYEAGTGNAMQTDSGPDRAGSQTWTFTHNTVVVPGTSSGFYMEPNPDWTSDMVFQDNLVYATSGMSGGHGFVDSYADQGGDITEWAWIQWTIDNNCYYSPGAYAWYGRENDGGDSTIGDWRSQTGQEANSIITDPEFTNLGGRDFTLANNGQGALTASSTNGPVGCYVTGSEEIGIRANPSY